MANRYVSFGYEITDGRICVIPNEAEVVRNIYALYIQGLSLLEIANRLNMLTISYANDGRPWNKNIVKRILENKKYTGEDGYPQVISEETARLALECKDKKYTHLSAED